VALRSALFVFVFVLAGPVACRDAPRAAGEKPVSVLSPTEPLPEFPCVPFQQLRKHLPSTLEGLERVRDEGSSGRYGEVSISEAERSFRGTGGEELSIRIVDTTLVDQLGHAIRAATEASPSPIQNEHVLGFVRFDPEPKRAEANLLVAGRFMVAITGTGYQDAARVRRVAEQFDVDGLALLR
jgi:hypothetical protein